MEIVFVGVVCVMLLVGVESNICYLWARGGVGETNRATFGSPRTETASLTGSPTINSLVASFGGSILKVPIPPVKPGSSPSLGSGRTVRLTGADSSSVKGGGGAGIMAGPEITREPVKRLPVKHWVNTERFPDSIGVRTVWNV